VVLKTETRLESLVTVGPIALEVALSLVDQLMSSHTLLVAHVLTSGPITRTDLRLLGRQLHATGLRAAGDSLIEN